MPKYILKCPGCRKVEERYNIRVKDCDKQVCKCGEYMQVQIVRIQFRMRDGRPDVLEWKRQRGVLDL